MEDILDVHVCQKGFVSMSMLTLLFCIFLLWKLLGL